MSESRRDRPFLDRVPTFDELHWPALEALKKLGSSASIAEHVEKIVEFYTVSEDVASQPHGDSGRSELEYRLAWARTTLKRCGYLENSSRGVWAVTESGRVATPEQLKKAVSAVRLRDAAAHKDRLSALPTSEIVTADAHAAEQVDWRDSALAILRTLAPDAFERLCQRLLRESGFVEVNVTGRTGDGGIDGTGILQVSLVSFHVLFQCKRYSGSVGAGAVRDFRGAMVGRTDKGLLITTGSFTPDAKREATRDGAPPIELIDGVGLCEHLKTRSLGVETRMVEEVAVQPAWFERL